MPDPVPPLAALKRQFLRIMRWAALFSVVVAALAVLLVAQGDSEVRIHMLIATQQDRLFPGMKVEQCHLFRITRTAELEVDEDRDEDLLQALERELAQRRFGPPVRLEVAASISDHVLDLLVRELDMDSHDVLRVPGILDLSSLWQVFGETEFVLRIRGGHHGSSPVSCAARVVSRFVRCRAGRSGQ